jgi:hypothetical protein
LVLPPLAEHLLQAILRLHLRRVRGADAIGPWRSYSCGCGDRHQDPRPSLPSNICSNTTTGRAAGRGLSRGASQGSYGTGHGTGHGSSHGSSHGTGHRQPRRRSSITTTAPHVSDVPMRDCHRCPDTRPEPPDPSHRTRATGPEPPAGRQEPPAGRQEPPAGRQTEPPRAARLVISRSRASRCHGMSPWTERPSRLPLAQPVALLRGRRAAEPGGLAAVPS